MASSPSTSQNELPELEFIDIPTLMEEMKQVRGDVVLIRNVSPASFSNILDTKPRPFPYRIRRYQAKEQLLFITIPTLIHETLHAELYATFIALLERMSTNTRTMWRTTATTTYRPQGHPRGDGGEGDSTGRPKSVPSNHWPTLIIEAGESESLTGLRHDMRWWFETSNHEVKIVLLAKFNHLNQHVLIERWQEEPRIRPGATRTRRSATSTPALEPVMKQVIHITRHPITNDYHVANGPLVFPFRLLFLRQPGPRESDIIFDDEELQRYAHEVWESIQNP